MSLVELQSVLGRLYVDGPLLDQFCANPRSVLQQYDLTPREAGAIEGIDRTALRRFAASLRMKTGGRFKGVYHLIFKLNPRVANKYFARFYELRTIRPNEVFTGPILELGEFFERSFCNNPELPCYASELARYERVLFIVRFDPRNASPAPSVTTRSGSGPAFHASRGVSVVRFNYDMAAIEKAIAEGTVPASAERTPCAVVFQSRRRGHARKFHVSPSTADLIDLCSCDARTVEEFALTLAAEPDAIAQAVSQLVTLGLVEEVPGS